MQNKKIKLVNLANDYSNPLKKNQSDLEKIQKEFDQLKARIKDVIINLADSNNPDNIEIDWNDDVKFSLSVDSETYQKGAIKIMSNPSESASNISKLLSQNNIPCVETNSGCEISDTKSLEQFDQLIDKVQNKEENFSPNPIMQSPGNTFFNKTENTNRVKSDTQPLLQDDISDESNDGKCCCMIL